MGRHPIELKNPEIAKHIHFLIKHHYTDHEVADLISGLNHHRISHKLVGRYRKRHESKVPTKTSKKSPYGSIKPLPWTCDECKSERLIFDRENGEVVCAGCGLVNAIRKGITISKGQQIEGYLAESALSEAHGLGSWLDYGKLGYIRSRAFPRGLGKIRFLVFNSVRDTKPKEFRTMRNHAQKILESLDYFASKSDELVKARKAQIAKSAAELIWLIYEKSKKELADSPVLSESIVKVNWRNFVPSVIGIILSDFLPENHRALKQFNKQYSIDQTLASKLEKLLDTRINGKAATEPVALDLATDQTRESPLLLETQ